MRVLLPLVWLSLVACGDGEPSADHPGVDPATTPASADASGVEPPTASGGSVAAPVADPTAVADAGAPRVVFVGTSLTAGFGLDDPIGESWPARVGELARGAGSPVRIVNAGVSGDTSAGGLRRVVALLDPPPDVVVLELGANDGLRGLPIDRLRANLDAAIDSIRRYAPDAGILVTRMEAPRNLGSDYVRTFAAVYDSLATRDGVRVTPFLLEGVAGERSLNQADGIHPLPEGHRRMADVVWPMLRELLPPTGGAE